MENLIGSHAVYRNENTVGALTITQEGLMTIFELDSRYSGEGIMRLAGVSHGEYINIGVTMPESGRLILRKKYSKSALASMHLEPEAGFYLIQSGDVYNKASAPESEAVPENAPESVTESALVNTQESVTESVPENVPESVTKSAPEIVPEIVPENIPENVQESVQEPVKNPAASGRWNPIADPSVLFSDPDISNSCKNVKGALTMEKNGVTLLAIPVSPGEPFPMMPVFCFGDSIRLYGKEYIVFKAKNGNFII